MKRGNQTAKKLSGLRRVPSRISDLKKRQYTVPELIGLTGISRKQVDYWAKTQLLSPLMRDMKAAIGKPVSFYTAAEVVKAMIIADLKRAGFSLRQIQQVAHNLEEHGINLAKAENYLLTDGFSVYYASSDNEVIDILKHHRQMLLLVPVHEQVKRLTMAA